MPNIIDRAFGVHAEALQLRARCGELLASNLANADTPNYKARDLDFSNALSEAQAGAALATTQAGHMRAQGGTGGIQTLYRVPGQSSLDGNTVDTQIEQARFAEVPCATGGDRAAVPVQVTGLVERQAPVNREYSPQHPQADADGYVYLSNVNMIEEMANTSKQLLLETLRLGQ